MAEGPNGNESNSAPLNAGASAFLPPRVGMSKTTWGATLLAIALIVGVFIAWGILRNSGDDSGDDRRAEKVVTPVKPETMTVQGTITLEGGCGSSLNSDYGFDNLPMQFSVKNSSGETIALSRLGKGTDLDKVDWEGPCLYSFKVNDVPSEGDIFSLVFGSRRPHEFTKTEAASSLDLYLGD